MIKASQFNTSISSPIWANCSRNRRTFAEWNTHVAEIGPDSADTRPNSAKIARFGRKQQIGAARTKSPKTGQCRSNSPTVSSPGQIWPTVCKPWSTPDQIWPIPGHICPNPGQLWSMSPSCCWNRAALGRAGAGQHWSASCKRCSIQGRDHIAKEKRKHQHRLSHLIAWCLEPSLTSFPRRQTTAGLGSGR